MTDADGHYERLARADDAVLAGRGEVRLAHGDREALLLVGWTCSVIEPPGMLRQLKRTTSSPASCGVVLNWTDSPVAVGELPELAGRSVWDGHAGTLSCPLEMPFRVRYHATVAATAVARGVGSVPNVEWYLVVSSTNGCSNS